MVDRRLDAGQRFLTQVLLNTHFIVDIFGWSLHLQTFKLNNFYWVDGCSLNHRALTDCQHHKAFSLQNKIQNQFFRLSGPSMQVFQPKSPRFYELYFLFLRSYLSATSHSKHLKQKIKK